MVWTAGVAPAASSVSGKRSTDELRPRKLVRLPEVASGLKHWQCLVLLLHYNRKWRLNHESHVEPPLSQRGVQNNYTFEALNLVLTLKARELAVDPRVS